MTRKSNIRLFLVAVSALLLASCKTPSDIAYFQDMADSTTVHIATAQTIVLQPLDQVSIVVNCIEPQIAAMFNLPYYTRRIGDSQSLTAGNNVATSTSATNISGYTVDSNGDINFPVLGKIHAAGKTREELAEHVRQCLIASNQIKDPTVTVEYMNLGVTVLGEVTRPGRYKIDRDRFTIMDALGLAGDLTINGQRKDVAVVRHTGQEDAVYRIDLTQAEDLYRSPAFFIQQGDLVYVTPNDKRMRESTVNGNNVRSSSFWISLASLLTSIAVLILR